MEALDQRVGALEDEQCVVVGAHPRRDDPVGRNSRLVGEQCGERLVLHLLEPAETDGCTLLPEPGAAPDVDQERGVVGIPAVDPDPQRSTVVVETVEREDPCSLVGRDHQVPSGDTELGERGGHLRHTRPALERPEHEVHGGRGGHRHGQAGEHAE